MSLDLKTQGGAGVQVSGWWCECVVLRGVLAVTWVKVKNVYVCVCVRVCVCVCVEEGEREGERERKRERVRMSE